MIVLAALAGAAIATGLVLGVRELIGRARPPAGPAPVSYTHLTLPTN